MPRDGAAPQKLGSGEIQAELLGGFFVVCRWSGNAYGTDFTAVQTLGYDVDKQAYSGSWVDSFMSYQWQYSGSIEDKSKELIFNATGPGPDGRTTKFRERYQFKSTQSITVIGEMSRNDQWVAFMTTELTRKEKKADSVTK